MFFVKELFILYVKMILCRKTDYNLDKSLLRVFHNRDPIIHIFSFLSIFDQAAFVSSIDRDSIPTIGTLVMQEFIPGKN